jgi:hypothetical protein
MTGTTESSPLKGEQRGIPESNELTAKSSDTSEGRDWIGLLAVPIVLAYLTIGMFVFYWLEDLSQLGGGTTDGARLRDSLYLSVTMLTTVGYGDFYPTTSAGKVAAIVFVVTGLSLATTCIGIIFARAADLTARKDSGPAKIPTVRAQVMKMLRALLAIIVVNFIGASWAVLHDGFDYLDGFYWAFITSTSVGFGDLETSEATRNFNIVFMIIAVGVVANGFGTLVEVIGIIGRITRIEKFCSRGVTSELIEEIDENGNGEVDRYEFCTYMLLNMGKIDQDDVDQVMALFKHYDLDSSGWLNVDDVVKVNETGGPKVERIGPVMELAWKLGVPVKVA